MSKKIAVVTGGSTGIGLAAVNCLAAGGFMTVVLGLNEGSGSTPAGAKFYPCDVSNGVDVAAVFSSIKDEFGQVDVLVNNAGVLSYGNAVELSENEWDHVMAVNVKGPWLCAKYAIPLMPQGSVVINVASVQSFVAQPFVAAYATSKSAILGLTRSIAIDFSPRVRCVAVCPGSIDTPMLQGALEQASDPQAMMEELNQSHLSGRIGQPEEVGELIAFLASDKCTFINGQAIRVDGGLGVNIGGSKN
ncbi:MAG: SDR family oxidoreductase [Halioglobus sp.]|nr:SDR family oxidoreductase [Halioglobus sp.]